MQLTCPRCRRELQFSGERPSFCGYCGNPLPKQDVTAELNPESAPTLAGPEEKVLAAAAFPQTVGGYRLLGQLGRGGMGTVFEAEDSSGRHVALKLISPDASTSREAVDRFRQEGRLASAIAHPRCVFVLAADEESGQPYIVMELMPGATLKDLVIRQGVLPPAKAVALILDVIEGLDEAHQHGVIHRDVKPSNCFLQADGRVKIGDFGLSKSLTGDAHLTRTGTFLGTPLFASPEQVRGEVLDPRTDVYSAAATLYFLLVGRAPFEGGDAGSTLARLVSDPPPPMRTLRPEISSALDRVVLRGLERQRERRWQNLEEFRAALLPFIPGKLSIGGMGIRLGAYLLDILILTPVNFFFGMVLLFSGTALAMYSQYASLAPTFTYFFLLEGFWGCSLGKRWLGLRVCGLEGRDAPGLIRALLRTCVFLLLINGPSFLIGLIWTTQQMMGNLLLVFLMPVLTTAIHVLLVTSTMRARNGYRGPHEFLSGTRVILLPRRRKRRLYKEGVGDELKQPEGLPAQVGPFLIEGALRWTGQERLLVGEDPGLGRKAWIWFRPAAAPPLTEARREVGRATRLRWLAGGQEGESQWDAFLAPRGCPLAEALPRPGLVSWTEARPVLEELTDELAAAVAECTLPDSLTLDQVWVQPSGRVQLLDVTPEGPEALAPKNPLEPSRQQAALDLLGQAAVLILEGKSRRLETPGPVRAPVPHHVSRFLHRLLGWPTPYKEVKDFQADLAETRHRPTEITSSHRAAHLVVLALLFFACTGCCLMPLVLSPRVRYVNSLAMHAKDGGPILKKLSASDPLQNRLQQKLTEWQNDYQAWYGTLSWTERQMALVMDLPGKKPLTEPDDSREKAASLLDRDLRSEIDAESMFLGGLFLYALWPLVWILWALALRGGISLWLTQIMLVRADGRKAGRWQCAWRALLFWLPVTFLLMASLLLDAWFWSQGDPQPSGAAAWVPWLSSLAWIGAVLLLPIYAVLAIWFPTRSLHDYLAGTYLVPR